MALCPFGEIAQFSQCGIGTPSGYALTKTHMLPNQTVGGIPRCLLIAESISVMLSIFAVCAFSSSMN